MKYNKSHNHEISFEESGNSLKLLVMGSTKNMYREIRKISKLS